MTNLKNSSTPLKDYYIENTRIIISGDSIVKTEKEKQEILDRVAAIISKNQRSQT